MRHKVAKRKLGRPSDHRMAMLKNLVRSLLTNDHVVTTVTRAQEARSLAEKLITVAKEDSIHARRQARRLLNDEDLVKYLFDQIAPRYRDRSGGYTRLVKIGFRRGDSAEVALLQLVE